MARLPAPAAPPWGMRSLIGEQAQAQLSPFVFGGIETSA
jgi:hypothetical protein